MWWTYNNPLFSSSVVNYWHPFRTTSSSGRQLSAKTNNYRYHCLRSAGLMNPDIDGIDALDIKNKCIRSVGHVLRPLMEDCWTLAGEGTGVFVVDDNRLMLLTCYHVVAHLPVVWVEYVKSYVNQVVVKCPYMRADVIYCEPHWDLAILRFRKTPSRVYNTSTTMSMTTTNTNADAESIGFGASVAMIGNGNAIHFQLHPGMIRTPRVDNNMLPNKYYVSTVPFGEQLPYITHTTSNVPGFSGSPLIDTSGQLCGLVWGGSIERFLISYAIDYKTLSAFINRAIVYESDGKQQTRLRKRFEWDIQSNRRLMGIIVTTQPFSGSFTVQLALPVASTDAIGIIGSRIWKVNGQVCNTIDNIRLAIDNRQQIKVTIRSTIDDDSSSSNSKDSMKTINTILSIVEHDISIMPLVL
ncbi:uncharacterized protein LOC128955028 [Oppia nitens]|uniref:uncharacterized protein LOC128955028 n=1 Tax=Oppia nitens TaxID=1686743 RepID=UPI0023D98186|nr:uncharacterized protein LOC128955028 [Oppia nitens]